MHLKSVTLKGFKSFAQPTTFALEPGVTAIVGPNGSGKSNVVDALAWVMGEQGAKTLRGGKMDDVIFAGTSTRGPLGRAEVRLTIDNGDGELPIDYTEVTISRTLFRNGVSEYAINGDTCRLLDVQELLSDSGLGREMHVIVGQGRLDSVLQATPEERRGFIEEAAGILKHRRRKDKTLRKLEAMESNLTRLSDLAGELRRQLKPLGRQAEMAREAAGIAAIVRDARARLLADDLVTLRGQLAQHARDEQARATERMVVHDHAANVRARIELLEAEQRSDAVDAARRVAFSLEQVQERLRSLHTLAAQRLTLLGDHPDRVEAGPTVTRSDIDEARARVIEIAAGLGSAQDAASFAARRVVRAGAELDALDLEIAAQSALVSEHDMRMVALRGSAQAAASALAAMRTAVARQQEALDAAQRRRSDAGRVLAALEPAPDLEGAGAEVAAVYERSQRDAAEAQNEADALRDRLHGAERECDSLTAQIAALGRALDVRNAASQLIAAGGPGIRGLVSDAVHVQPGYETAVAAVLGPLAEGVLVDSRTRAHEIAVLARDSDLGVVDIAIGDIDAPPHEAVDGVVSARDVVSAPEGLLGVLAHVFIAESLAEASTAIGSLAAVGHARPAVVVTRAGEILTEFTVRAGSGAGRSRLELSAERDAAAERLAEMTVVADSLREALSERVAALDQSRQRTRAAVDDLRAHDAALASHAEHSNRAVMRHEAAVAECDRLESELVRAQTGVDDAARAMLSIEAELMAAEEVLRPVLDASARGGLVEELDASRDAEVGARLEVETLRERVRAGEAVVADLESRREREQQQAVEAARRAVSRRAQREIAADVAVHVPPLLASVDRSVNDARVELARAESERVALTSELSELRSAEARTRERLSRLTEEVHGLELQMHEKRLHASSLVDQAQRDLGLAEHILTTEYGPEEPVPAAGDDAAPSRYDRAEQMRRLQQAERTLGQLGRVNPLALEEYAALEQRHSFLTEQLADLTQTRRDLLAIVDELDERMQVIFLAAFEDTRAAFAEVFPILFPGGSGSISLTDPDGPLTTGIDVSVRPAGKRIERLSLLSGGERSLAAVALLTAIFQARPSPFYILDEVEAALDDANLGRLLGVFEQLRQNSQLIVITHQKRTMEIADALYGVSMRQDGVSAVVGQRVRERVPA